MAAVQRAHSTAARRSNADWGGGSDCSWTFNAPGTYYYSRDAYCQGANGYIGKIRVRPQGTVTSYNSTRIIFNMSSPFHLVRSGPGPLFAELIVAGRSSGPPVQIATVTADLVLLESNTLLAANAETLVIQGTNMPLECPGDSQEVRIEGLVLWSDFNVARCTSTSVILRLQPGKQWGAAGSKLRVTRYSYSGPIDVAVATIVPAFEPQTSQPMHAHPTLDLSSHFIGTLSNQSMMPNLPNTAAHIVLSGAQLRGVYANLTAADVSVQFFADSGPVPYGTVEADSDLTANTVKVRLRGFTEVLPGNLYAQLTIAGKKSEATYCQDTHAVRTCWKEIPSGECSILLCICLDNCCFDRTRCAQGTLIPTIAGGCGYEPCAHFPGTDENLDHCRASIGHWVQLASP